VQPPALSLLALAVAAATPAAGVPPPVSVAELSGTYRLSGTAEIDAEPFPSRREELHADAVLSPGASAREVRVDLAVETFRCTLHAEAGADGGLAFPPGQRCPVALGALGEGHATATLREASGAARADGLELSLAFAVSGRVRLRAGGALDAIGQALSLPGTGGRWADVSGEARGWAAGMRDASRAAEVAPPPGRAP
jgi:hypothetical protein